MSSAALVKKLVSSYIDAAVAHGGATEGGDYEAANHSVERLEALYEQLLESGGAVGALRSLMEHDDISVRHWAAYHCLPLAPQEAEETLREIARVKGSLVSFAAQITLEKWRKGKLGIAP